MSGGATPLLPDTPHRSPAAVALLGSVAPVEPALEKRFLRRGLPEAEGLGGEGGDVAADREGGGRRPRGRGWDGGRVGVPDEAEIVHRAALRGSPPFAGA